MKTELLLNLQLILGTALLILLGVFTFVLINRIRQRRTQLVSSESSPPAFPYPSKRAAEPGAGLAVQMQVEADALIPAEHARWLNSFFLPDPEPGRAFVRTGVAKHWLRYQLTATSLAQAAGLLVCALQAGADPLAQTRFDALLAFCLSRPAANNPDLMSWQVMPDVVPGARLDADPQAEAWLAFALLCGAAQWARSSRFDYTQLARLRLDALLARLQGGMRDMPQSKLISPGFARLFQRTSGNADWLKAANLDALPAQETADPVATGGAQTAVADEEARLALLALAYGLLPEARKHGTPANAFSAGIDLLARLEKLKEETPAVSAPSEGFSPLSLLACYAAAAGSAGSADLAREYWTALSQTEANFGDGLGSTLRLLALMALNGSVWFPEAFREPASA
ncbi:MAG TPA: hypothetical protein PKW57_04840 [Anaerolineaceae bacterium]|nr:hypothetical protein [Anaerolineaceae bacterium]